MNTYYYRVDGIRALQVIKAPDRRTADASVKLFGKPAVFVYGCSD